MTAHPIPPRGESPSGAPPAGAPPSPPQPPRDPLPPSLAWLTIVAVASLPVAVALPLPFLEKRALNLTLFDPLAGLLTLGWAVWAWRRGVCGPWLARWWRAAWPALPLLGAGMLSLLVHPPLGRGLPLAAKAAFQSCEYLLLTPWIVLPLLCDPSWRRRLLLALLGVATVAALSIPLLGAVVTLEDMPAWREGFVGDRYLGGLFGNRHTAGLMLALLLPILARAAFWLPQTHGGGSAPETAPDGSGGDAGRDAGGGVAPCSTAASPSLGPTPLVCGRLGPWLRLGVEAVALLFLATMGTAIALAGGAVGWIVGRISVDRRAGPTAMATVMAAFLLAAFVAESGSLRERPAARARRLTEAVQSWRLYRPAGAITPRPTATMRSYRWHANLNMVAANPIVGVGWGQYQRRIAGYRGAVDTPEARTDRPDLYDLETNEPLSFGWFFLVTGETGGLGALALAVLLGALLVGPRSNMTRPEADYGAGLGEAALAAGAVLLVSGLWVSPMVRGCGPLLGFLLAIRVACTDAFRERVGED